MKCAPFNHTLTKTYQPSIHRGQIVQLLPERGYGILKADSGEDVYLSSKHTDLRRYAIGENVAFEMKPIISSMNRFLATHISKVFRSKDGYLVMDRRYSHVHDDLDKRLPTIIGRIDCNNEISCQRIVKYDAIIGKTSCVKVSWEDEIVYAIREGRTHHSKFVKNRQKEPTNCVSIILKNLGRIYSIVTCYYCERHVGLFSGVIEPIDPEIFWEDHALIWGSEPVLHESITSINPWTKVDESNTLASHFKAQNDEICKRKFEKYLNTNKFDL
jgi:hypothetical protein